MGNYVMGQFSVNRMRRPITVPQLFPLAPEGTATALFQGKKEPHQFGIHANIHDHVSQCLTSYNQWLHQTVAGKCRCHVSVIVVRARC